MLEPVQPIEGRRPDRFMPPHCPRKGCPDHLFQGPGYCAKRDGSYVRKCDPLRRIPRFRCSTCKGGFSKQSFATTYYMKRPELLRPIASLLLSGAANRQIARHLDCSPSTVTELTVRLGEHSTLFHDVALGEIKEIEEPVDFDHFETFVRSKQERLGIGTAAGKKYWFIYAAEGARYQGAMKRGRHRRKLKRAPKPTVPGVVTASTWKVLKLLIEKSPHGLELISDDNPHYSATVHRLNCNLPVERLIRHSRFANPKRLPGEDPGIARRRNRAMYAVDLAHKLIRHNLAHHSRKTFAFGRKTRNVVGIVKLFVVWRNFIKIISERRRSNLVSPAMQIGLTTKLWTWRDFLAERLFPERVGQVAV